MMKLLTLDFLAGYRTKIIGIGMTIKGVLEVIDGTGDGWQTILEGLGLLFLRKAIK